MITAVILAVPVYRGGYGKYGARSPGIFMALINNVLIITRVSGYRQEIILGMILIAVGGSDQWLLKRTKNN